MKTLYLSENFIINNTNKEKTLRLKTQNFLQKTFFFQKKTNFDKILKFIDNPYEQYQKNFGIASSKNFEGITSEKFWYLPVRKIFNFRIDEVFRTFY